MRFTVAVAALIAAVLLSFQVFTPSANKAITAQPPAHCHSALDPERVVNIAIEWEYPQAFTELIYTVPADSYLFVTDYVISGRAAKKTHLVEDLATVKTVKVPSLQVADGSTTINLFNGSFRSPLVFAPDSRVLVELVQIVQSSDSFDCLLSGRLVAK